MTESKSNPEFMAFLAERDDIMRSLDTKRMQDFHLKHNPGSKRIPDDMIEMVMHKARTACLSLTREERQLSKDWLLVHGYGSMDDGDLDAPPPKGSLS